jgi:hypothetical protein
MSEETNPEETGDRYALEITGGLALILDLAGEAPAVVESYDARDVKAVARLAVLNRRAAAGMDDPTSEPLSPSLAAGGVPVWDGAPFRNMTDGPITVQTPGGAKILMPGDTLLNAPLTRQPGPLGLFVEAIEQRSAPLSALLAEARGVEAEAVKQIREFAVVLSRATEVRQRIEDRMAALNESVIDSHGAALSKPQPY